MSRAPRRAPRTETDWIRRITHGLPAGEGVVIGPGDDAAVLRPGAGRELVATTDAFIEGVHWRAAWLDPAGVGRRLAAANLSDLAAMAATPRWALVSAGVPAGWDAAALEAFERGLAAALAAHGAAIVGGNLARTPGPAWFSLTLLGEVEPGRAWTRFGARPGDRIAVTGSPGRAAAALRVGERAHQVRFTAAACQPVLSAWRDPTPRVAFATALARTGGVTAAIDLSDGFHGELVRLCEASGVGAAIVADGWPRDPGLEEAARLLLFQRALGSGWTRARHRWVRFAPAPARVARMVESLRLSPSDDYELVLTVDPALERACIAAAQAARVPLAWVGWCTDAPQVLTWRDTNGTTRPLEGRGWDPFRTQPVPSRGASGRAPSRAPRSS